MADLFHKPAKNYAEARPSYPEELFQFIASKTPTHHLVWDVGTGNGQAAKATLSGAFATYEKLKLAGIYKNVIATDTSQKQLDHAPKLGNINYQLTPPTMSMAEIENKVAGQSSIDLVTIAQAIHWFDLPTFYQQVKWILKKPDGVIAAWCYTTPEVSDSVDSVFGTLYTVDTNPYWDPAREMVDDKYRGLHFPFEPVEGVNHTGPLEFKTERLMDLKEFFTYIRSWSAYHTAKGKGVELLRDDLVEKFKQAWNEDGDEKKVVKFPIYLRIGRVGNLN